MKPAAKADGLRPISLDTFIGQESAVNQVRVALVSAQARQDALPHILMSGPPGLGKTTLAAILANEMKVELQSFLSTAVNDQNAVIGIMSKFPFDGYDLNTGEIVDVSKVVYPIVFIDEVHRLAQSVTEFLHTALEDFKITVSNRNHMGVMESAECWVPKFTVIGATNYLGTLPKPFLDRFPVKLAFEVYPKDKIAEIVNGAAKRTSIRITDEAILEIASKSRGVPRIAIQYLLSCRDVAIVANPQATSHEISWDCVKQMFDIHEVDDSGLTRLDRKVLTYLSEIKRPVGVRSIAQAVDEDVETIESTVEPWLVRQGFIVKTMRGRAISEKGLSHLGYDRGQTVHGLRRIVKT